MREFGHGFSNQHSEDLQFQQQMLQMQQRLDEALRPIPPAPVDPTKPVLFVTFATFLSMGALVTWWLDLAFSGAAVALFGFAMFYGQTYNPKRARRVRIVTALVMLLGAVMFIVIPLLRP